MLSAVHRWMESRRSSEDEVHCQVPLAPSPPASTVVDTEFSWDDIQKKHSFTCSGRGIYKNDDHLVLVLNKNIDGYETFIGDVVMFPGDRGVRQSEHVLRKHNCTLAYTDLPCHLYQWYNTDTYIYLGCYFREGEAIYKFDFDTEYHKWVFPLVKSL